MNLDYSLYHFINQTLVSAWADVIMVYATNKWTWLPLYLLLVFLGYRAFRKKVFWMLICVVIAVGASDQICSAIMKPIFKRERPCHNQTLNPRLPESINCSDSYSMASSHAANHFAIAVLMILMLPSMSLFYKLMLLFWATLIAYSRVYCGVHYPSDVLVGALVGTVMALLISIIYKKGLETFKLE
jgi:undecaprenyl-diphosphatase